MNSIAFLYYRSTVVIDHKFLHGFLSHVHISTSINYYMIGLLFLCGAVDLSGYEIIGCLCLYLYYCG